MRNRFILAGAAAAAALLLTARPGDAQVTEQAFRGGRTGDPRRSAARRGRRPSGRPPWGTARASSSPRASTTAR